MIVFSTLKLSSARMMSASLPMSSEPFVRPKPMRVAGCNEAQLTASYSGISELVYAFQTPLFSLSTLPAMVPSGRRHSIPLAMNFCPPSVYSPSGSPAGGQANR